MIPIITTITVAVAAAFFVKKKTVAAHLPPFRGGDKFDLTKKNWIHER